LNECCIWCRVSNQRASIDQASDRVQQREREVLQETPY
jgi:hypothetical protein